MHEDVSSLAQPAKRSRKGLVIAIICAALILTGGAVAISLVLRPEKPTPEYFFTAQELIENSTKNWNDLADPLREAIDNFNGGNITASKFAESVSKAQTSIDAYRAALDQLKSSEYYSSDEDLRTSTDSLIDKSIYYLSGVEQKLKVANGLYGFSKTIEKLTAANYSKVLGECAKYLQDTGDKQLAEFGERFVAIATEYIAAAAKYSKTGSAVDRKTYETKEREFQKLADDSESRLSTYSTILETIPRGQGEVIDELNSLMSFLVDKTKKPSEVRASGIIDIRNDESSKT